jgi:hypothetical protein
MALRAPRAIREKELQPPKRGGRHRGTIITVEIAIERRVAGNERPLERRDRADDVRQRHGLVVFRECRAEQLDVFLA